MLHSSVKVLSNSLHARQAVHHVLAHRAQNELVLAELERHVSSGAVHRCHHARMCPPGPDKELHGDPWYQAQTILRTRIDHEAVHAGEEAEHSEEALTIPARRLEGSLVASCGAMAMLMHNLLNQADAVNGCRSAPSPIPGRDPLLEQNRPCRTPAASRSERRQSPAGRASDPCTATHPLAMK